MTTAAQVMENMVPFHCDQAHVGAFFLKDIHEDGTENRIFVAFSASDYVEHVTLPKGKWEIHINGEKAGTKSLGTVQGTLDIPPISAMVLIRKVK